MDSSVISLRDIGKSYKLYDSPQARLKEALHPFGKKYHREFQALQGVSAEIGRNEIVGIVGKNGSGKSTLLKLIAHVLTPSSGSMEVREPVTPLLELGAGLNPNYSGIENIHFYGSVLGVPRQRINELQEEIVAFADIGDHIHQPLRTYSSGMRSRLGFAIAVHIDPQILIVDEILSVGDIAFQRKCYRKMEELFMQGSTVLYVSHNMQSVVQLCNRALLLHGGRLLMDDNPDSVVKAYQKLIYEGKFDPQGAAGEAARAGAASGSNATPESIVPPRDSSSFDNELRSTPYKVNTAITDFDQVFIVDGAGRSVNQLEQGKHYSIGFRATFKQNVSAISFGCQILTLQGIIVSGSNMSSSQQMTYPAAVEGDRIQVNCDFRCMLVPGTYVIKIFSAPEDGTPASVVEDAMMFQVKPQQRSNGGFVYLDQNIYAKKLGTSQA